MIRFRRLFSLETPRDQERFAELDAIFARAFPHETDAVARIEDQIAGRTRLAFEPILLIAEDRRGRVIGFTYTYYFSDIRFAYLQYIASDPERPARGIGGALYEALREHLSAKGARGLLLDVPPDEPDMVDDPARLSVNRKRMKFYERYGARVVVGTAWDTAANPRNEGYLTQLLYDPLGTERPLRRADARKAVRRILVQQYRYHPDDPFVGRIAASMRDDPLRLRPPRHVRVQAADAAARGWIKPLSMVVAERHVIHHLTERGYVERPVRVRSVLKGLEGFPVERIAARRFPESHIRAVHDPHLVDYLAAISRHLPQKRLVYPEVFPIRRPERRPRALEDRAGYFCADTFTPLTANVWAAARASVDAALTGASLLARGDRFVYALCRPPGHHAERRIFGGFCYLNNAACAAHYLSATGTVALLDLDHHHGNGAQDIFYERRDVYTLSIHGHPQRSYPYFSGYADERGSGEGTGFNRNFPLPPGVDDDAYLETLERALALVQRFRPRWLVVALGFDIMKGDPTGGFLVTNAGMRRIAARLAGLDLPILVVQEGGYALENLRLGSRAFFSSLCTGWY